MQLTIVLTGCARCGGDLTPDYDRYGSYLRCLQCGATFDEPPEQEIALAMAQAG